MRCENSASACFSNCIFTTGAVHAFFSKWRANTSLRPQLGILSHYCRLSGLKFQLRVFSFIFRILPCCFQSTDTVPVSWKVSSLGWIRAFLRLYPCHLCAQDLCALMVACAWQCMTCHVIWRFPKTMQLPNHVIWIRVILTPILRIIASQIRMPRICSKFWEEQGATWQHWWANWLSEVNAGFHTETWPAWTHWMGHKTLLPHWPPNVTDLWSLAG